MSNLNKQELDELLKLKGQIRGVVFYTDANYVLEKEGDDGLKKLEKRVKDFNYPIDYRKTDKTTYFPVGLRAISLILIKDTFNWSDEEIRKMGWNAPSISPIIKIFMRFFSSVKMIAEKVPNMWTNHYHNIGKLSAVTDEKKKYFILKLEDFKVHHLFCVYLSGYFTRVVSFALNTKKIDCRETKCSFRGDKYDEFTITWE